MAYYELIVETLESTNSFNVGKQMPDKVITFVIESARRHLDAEKLILFGSRARNSHTELSDYDIAVMPNASLAHKWSSFWNDVDEYAPTLKHIDLVNLLEPLDQQFRERILAEGVLIYGK